MELVEATPSDPLLPRQPRADALVLLRTRPPGRCRTSTTPTTRPTRPTPAGHWRAVATSMRSRLAQPDRRRHPDDRDRRHERPGPFACPFASGAGMQSRPPAATSLRRLHLPPQRTSTGSSGRRATSPFSELHRGPQCSGRPQTSDHPMIVTDVTVDRQQGTRRTEPDAAASGGPRRHLLRPPSGPGPDPGPDRRHSCRNPVWTGLAAGYLSSVKWTPGVLALVTAVVFVALVGIGVAYVVHQDSDQVSGGPAPRPSSTADQPVRGHSLGGHAAHGPAARSARAARSR